LDLDLEVTPYSLKFLSSNCEEIACLKLDMLNYLKNTLTPAYYNIDYSKLWALRLLEDLIITACGTACHNLSNILDS
jgi:hypothetical protein